MWIKAKEKSGSVCIKELGLTLLAGKDYIYLENDLWNEYKYKNKVANLVDIVKDEDYKGAEENKTQAPANIKIQKDNNSFIASSGDQNNVNNGVYTFTPNNERIGNETIISSIEKPVENFVKEVEAEKKVVEEIVNETVEETVAETPVEEAKEVVEENVLKTSDESFVDETTVEEIKETEVEESDEDETIEEDNHDSTFDNKEKKKKKRGRPRK